MIFFMTGGHFRRSPAVLIHICSYGNRREGYFCLFLFLYYSCRKACFLIESERFTRKTILSKVKKEIIMKQYLIPFLVSMVPLIELRGAIPIAQGMGLPIVTSYLVCIIGNMIPVPFIYLFARKVLEWGADKPVTGKFFSFCLEKGQKGGRKLTEKAGRGLFLALLLFVGIPLPGTGAWTGTLAASILDMDFVPTIIAVMLGVLLAGVIMMTASVVGFSLL